jgi:hypothetical protein
MNRSASSLLIAFALTTAGAARAETIVEPSSGTAFEASRTVDGKPFTLLGTGIRKKWMVKVYAMGLYVAEEDARRAFPALAARAGGKDKAKLTASDHAQSFVIWGTFPKVGVLHFVRNVEVEKIREAFKDGFEEELSDKAPPELKKATESFLSLFTGEIKEGQEIVLTTNGDGKITVDIAGAVKPGPSNPKLVRALWSVWLGGKPISTDMRKSLVERVDVLGR